MKKFFLPLLVFAVLALSSCSTCSNSGFKFDYSTSDEMEIVSNDLRGFERIEVVGSPTVYYAQADTFSVRVKGPKDLVPNILADVNGNTLSIRNKGKMGVINVNFGANKGLAVYVTSPDLIGVTLSGSGDFICESPVDTDVLNIQLKGSGDVQFTDVVCDRCDAELVGSGDLSIKHLDTRETSATLIGSGDLDIRQMNTVNTQLQLRGSGDINVEFVRGCGSVNAELFGSGDITLNGEVKHFDMRKRGSGDIDSSNLKVK